MVPKITVITPIYNAFPYIKTAYRSIRKQTLTDWEWIVIDDGSGDNTLDELVSLAKVDNRIKVLEQEHKGAGEARNLGISNALGDYIAFLDVDDEFYDANALDKMYSAAVKKRAVVVGSYRVTKTCGVIQEEPLFRNFDIGSIEGEWVYFRDYQEDYHFHSYIFRREFIVENDIGFPDYKRYQDPVFLLKILNSAEKVLVVPIVLYCYRFGNQDANTIENNIGEVLKGIKENLSIAKENNYKDLIDRLIVRVNLSYYPEIMRNFNPEVNQLLLDINNICKENNNEIVIIPLRHVMEAALTSVNSFYYNDLTTRYEALVQPDNNMIEEYLIDNDINTIAIYGLGVFGLRLLNDLKGTKIKIIAGIDKNTERDDIGIRIYKPEQVKEISCQAVVVTPIWYGDMACKMERMGVEKVIVLKTLIYQLGDKLCKMRAR